MITAWFTGIFPTKVVLPPYRYKQTSVVFTNDGSATYANGYVASLVNTANRFGDSCTARWTFDPLQGEIFAIQFTRIRGSSNSSSNIRYQANGGAIAAVYVGTGNTIFFNGQTYPIGTIVNNRIDLAIVLNMTTKMVKVLYSLTIGGAKTLLAEKPFTVTSSSSNLFEFYVDSPSSSATSILATNNEEFAV